jgi:osmotically-inducible protein OsmY
MNEREGERGRQTEPRTREREYSSRYEGDEARAMTQGSESSVERQQGTSEERDTAGWKGYVVPYRYYGPGYRGVGYYSVMYQGSDEPQSDEPRAQERWADRGSRGTVGGWKGGFAGRGPKGYRRSDERLREEVSDRLMADDQIDASEIEVTVKDGEVTLTGTVEDRSAKRRAEDIAEQVMGIRDVMNQIRVEYGSGQTTGTSTTSRNASRSNEQQNTVNGRKRTTATSR